MGVLVSGIYISNEISPADVFSVTMGVVPIPQLCAVEGNQLNDSAFSGVLDCIPKADCAALSCTSRRVRSVSPINALQGVAICIRHSYYRCSCRAILQRMHDMQWIGRVRGVSQNGTVAALDCHGAGGGIAFNLD